MKYPFNPSRVIDGDTYQGTILLVLGEPLLGLKTTTEIYRTIRLCLIDTPETRGAYLQEAEDLGKAIKSLVTRIFSTARKLEFEPTSKPDNFGRLIGEIHVTDFFGEGFILSDFLLNNGLATLYDSPGDASKWIYSENCVKALETCMSLKKKYV